MKVFISYSGEDSHFAKSIGSLISDHADPVFWDRNKLPGEEDWPSIFNWIHGSEIVLALVSESVVKRGMAVGQEIGYARKAEKIIIPFVSKKIPPAELGFLKGLTAIHYDESDPASAINELRDAIQRQKIKLKSSQHTAIFAIGMVALFFMMAESK